MPPKFKFTKEQVINTCLTIVREEGFDSLSARKIASKLNSSSKIIFGLFSNMQDLQNEVILAMHKLYEDRVIVAVNNSDIKYKAAGKAYIKFAVDEPNMFRQLFMTDVVNKINDDKVLDQMYAIIVQQLGISLEEAKKLHLQSWAFVHGIATIIAISKVKLSDEQIDEMLKDYYMGVKCRLKEVNGSN